MKKIALITAALLTIAAFPGCIYHPGCSDPCGGGTNCSIEIIRGGPLDPCAYVHAVCSCPLLPWNWCCQCGHGYGHGCGTGCGFGPGCNPWTSACDAPCAPPMMSMGCESSCGASCGVPAYGGYPQPTFGGDFHHGPMPYGGPMGGAPTPVPQLAPQPAPHNVQQPVLAPMQQNPPMPPAAPMGGAPMGPAPMGVAPQTSLPAGLYGDPTSQYAPATFHPGYVTPASYTAPAPMAQAPAPMPMPNTPPRQIVPAPNAQWIRSR